MKKLLIKYLWKESSLTGIKELKELAVCLGKNDSVYALANKLKHGGEPHTLLVDAVVALYVGQDTLCKSRIDSWKRARNIK